MKSKEVKIIPGYNGKYLINEDGQVWRTTAKGTLARVSESQGRVRLYRNGQVWRPLIKTLVERTFT